MAFQERSDRLAIKKEITAGSLVLPTTGTDFLAIRPGANVEITDEILANEEISGSLGPSASQLGLQSTNSPIPLYLKNSGVEGTAPNMDPVLEGAFGSKVAQSSEIDIAAGSTVSAVNVDSAGDFVRGMGYLVKNASNAYEIRAIKEIVGTVITPSFNHDNVPEDGAGTGRPILYQGPAAGVEYPSFSIIKYAGNGGAIVASAGNKVSDFGMSMGSGELIPADVTFAGVIGFFNPIEITASNNALDFDDAGGEENATISSKIYRSPIALALEIANKMNALTGDTITVAYTSVGTSKGKFTISTGGGTLTLLWNTGANTANTIGAALGFSVGADDTGATTYTSDNTISLSSIAPVLDSVSPNVFKNNEIFIGGVADNLCISTRSTDLSISNTLSDVLDACAETGRSSVIVTERSSTITFVTNLPQFDADKFDRQINNTTTSAQINFGPKDSSGNWIPAKSGVLYTPTAKITGTPLGTEDGQVTMSIELTPFVDSGANEIFLTLL